MIISDVGLKNYHNEFYPNFRLYRNRLKNNCGLDESQTLLIENLNIIKKDLKRLINFIEDNQKGIFKERLIEYLHKVSDNILVDAPYSETSEYGLLQLDITDKYIMFSVYFKSKKSPMTIIMTRKLNNMEFYFLEKINENRIYNTYLITYYSLDKDNVHMKYSYIEDYNFVNAEKFVSSLKKVLK